MEGPREIARATFADGHTEDLTTGPGVYIPAKSLAEFMRVCFHPHPVNVEVIETATPELPFDSVSESTDAQE